MEPLAPPGPDTPADLEGLEGLDPMDPVDPAELYGPSPETAGWLRRDDPAEDDGPSPAGPFREPGPMPADPPAAKIPRARPRASSSGRAAAPKITQAVRNDIEGKLGLLLQVGGTAWAARDPVCGGAFTAQLPAIRPAAVDLILLSPDLVAWFTGVGGGFMLWFNLLAAVWPVLATIWAHHGPGAAERDEAGLDAAAQAYAA